MARPCKTRQDERDVFRALAHPVRRKIVEATLQQTCSFEELRKHVRRSGPALAGHLRILRQAGLIVGTRIGHAVVYDADIATIRKGAKWLNGLATVSSGRSRARVDRARAD